MVFTLIAHLWTQPGKEAEMKALLLEASQIYLKDEGTINWFVMQDTKDPTAWSIVERYEAESSLTLHTENPYYKKFIETVGPLVDPSKPPQILKHNEL
ncbi:putative Antibiotic biosynthesis monooxygenase [Mycena venus]|uniref:Putative Antibiotic biosynthesis monooxygenase n=1 Tax=Mycena venus TaxID=2733690 RepID=A0A8H6XWE0_9AGAR|nr:putative Antibiotic biosynthesis monooxygenase [Mycena venus]